MTETNYVNIEDVRKLLNLPESELSDEKIEEYIKEAEKLMGLRHE